MKKAFALFIFVASAIISCAIFGVLHDMVTYQICPQYFTKFKFYQFGLIDDTLILKPYQTNQLVIATGIIATWWVGLIGGLVLGIINTFIQKNIGVFFKTAFVSLAIGICSAVLAAIIGYFICSIYTPAFLYTFIPPSVTTPDTFAKVGLIHTFSYLGGFIGIIIGIFYSFKQKKKYGKYIFTASN